MTTDDDKQVPDPDPWAGLDVGGAEGEAEEMTFSFEEFAEPAAGEPLSGPEAGAAAAEEHIAEDAASGDVFSEEPTPRDMPLAVFPPADAGDSDLDQAETDFGAADIDRDPVGQSPVISFSAGEVPEAGETPETAAEAGASPWDAALAEVGDDADAARGVGGFDADAFDDRRLAEELAAMDDDADAAAPSDAADFGDLDVDSGTPSEDLSFDTVASAVTSPFADRSDDGPFEQMAGSDDAVPAVAGEAAESDGDAVASIPLTAAVAAASGQAAVSATKPKKKSSGLGTALGVVGGGLLALPLTYAILLWGLQKDPFKLGRHLPQSILPAAVRAGAKPARKRAAAPVLDAAKSLDSLPVADAESAPETQPAVEQAPAAADPAPEAAAEEEAGGGAKPEMATATTEPAAPAPTDAAPPQAAESAATPAEPATVAVAVPAPSITPPSDLAPPPDITPPSALAVPTPSEPLTPAAEASVPAAAAAMPKEDALASLDALVAKPATDLPAAPPAEPLSPLDVTAVDDATATVAEALDWIEAHPADDTVGRDRLLVAWYRRLATLGEELVRLQTTAYDTGRPVEATPAAAAGMLDRIATSDRTLADVETLGGMWITSATRRADGASLVADVVATRQVGPYWSTKVLVPGGNADGSAREISVISREAPPVEAAAGRVLVTGVLFDGGAFWAADIRPVAGMPAGSADAVPAAPDREGDPVELPAAPVSPADAETPGPEAAAPADAGGGS
jgi:hypothetical protein